jgi:hypothetical protein
LQVVKNDSVSFSLFDFVVKHTVIPIGHVAVHVTFQNMDVGLPVISSMSLQNRRQPVTENMESQQYQVDLTNKNRSYKITIFKIRIHINVMKM